MLNAMEFGIVGTADDYGRWKVRQDTEFLTLQRYKSEAKKEKMKHLSVSVEKNCDILNGPRNRILSKKPGAGVV